MTIIWDKIGNYVMLVLKINIKFSKEPIIEFITDNLKHCILQESDIEKVKLPKKKRIQLCSIVECPTKRYPIKHIQVAYIIPKEHIIYSRLFGICEKVKLMSIGVVSYKLAGILYNTVSYYY